MPREETTPDFHQLVENHYQELYRFGFSLAKNESDAADLAQQTFLVWAEKGHALRDPAKVKSWLFTTLYREFLRLRRRGKYRADLEPEAFEAELPPVQPDIVRQLDGKQAVETLDAVDEIYREPLILFYMEGLAYKDIAEILALPIGTVMSRLSRGKAQLRKAIHTKVEIE